MHVALQVSTIMTLKNWLILALFKSGSINDLTKAFNEIYRPNVLITII